MPTVAIPTERTRERISADIEGLIVSALGAEGVRRFSPTTVHALGAEHDGKQLFRGALGGPLALLRVMSKGKKRRFYAEYETRLAKGGVEVLLSGPHAASQYELLEQLIEYLFERDAISEVVRDRLRAELPTLEF